MWWTRSGKVLEQKVCGVPSPSAFAMMRPPQSTPIRGLKRLIPFVLLATLIPLAQAQEAGLLTDEENARRSPPILR
jgi:hypothetical protein